MRLQVDFKTDRFPIAYNILVVSLIKEALKKSNEEYFKELFQYGEKKNKKSKNYCFSVYVKDFSIEGEEFIVKDKILINFSSPDVEFIVNLYNGLLKITELKYSQYTLKRNRITKIKEKNINNDIAIFKTLSPMYIKDKDNNFLEPGSENYEKELNYIADIILNNYRNYGAKKPLKFTPINMTKQVVKEEISGFKEKTGKKYIYINGYKGRFVLEGDREDLNDMYMLGLSFRRNQGFGMLEIEG